MTDVEAILQLVDPLLVAGILLEQLLVLVHQIVVLLSVSVSFVLVVGGTVGQLLDCASLLANHLLEVGDGRLVVLHAVVVRGGLRMAGDGTTYVIVHVICIALWGSVVGGRHRPVAEIAVLALGGPTGEIQVHVRGIILEGVAGHGQRRVDVHTLACAIHAWHVRSRAVRHALVGGVESGVQRFVVRLLRKTRCWAGTRIGGVIICELRAVLRQGVTMHAWQCFLLGKEWMRKSVRYVIIVLRTLLSPAFPDVEESPHFGRQRRQELMKYRNGGVWDMILFCGIFVLLRRLWLFLVIFAWSRNFVGQTKQPKNDGEPQKEGGDSPLRQWGRGGIIYAKVCV